MTWLTLAIVRGEHKDNETKSRLWMGRIFSRILSCLFMLLYWLMCVVVVADGVLLPSYLERIMKVMMGLFVYIQKGVVTRHC